MKREQRCIARAGRRGEQLAQLLNRARVLRLGLFRDAGVLRRQLRAENYLDVRIEIVGEDFVGEHPDADDPDSFVANWSRSLIRGWSVRLRRDKGHRELVAD